MGAFQSGFQMGQSAYNTGQEQQRQRVLDDRATEEYAFKKDERARGLKLRDAEDTAFGRIEALNRGTIDGGQASFSTPEGYGSLGPVTQDQQFNPAAGLTPRRATDTEYNNAFQQLAMAKRDVSALAGLRKEGKSIEYDDAYVAAGKKWDGFTDTERAELITKASYDQGIRGFGNWVPGTGKTAGYMNYLPPSGDPVKLSAKDAKQVFAISSLMDIDPSRARKELEVASTSVRAVARELFDENTKGVKENNDTQRDQDKSALERERIAVARLAASRSGSPARQTQAEAMQEKMTALAQVIQQSEPGLAPEMAMRKAAGILLKDPNVKDKADVGLEAQGLVRINGGLYRQGKGGELESVRLPGESATDRVLAQLAALGGDPFAPKIKAPTTNSAPPKPARGITTIIPPRSAADMQPQARLSDNDLAALALGIRR